MLVVVTGVVVLEVVGATDELVDVDDELVEAIAMLELVAVDDVLVELLELDVVLVEVDDELVVLVLVVLVVVVLVLVVLVLDVVTGGVVLVVLGAPASARKLFASMVPIPVTRSYPGPAA